MKLIRYFIDQDYYKYKSGSLEHDFLYDIFEHSKDNKMLRYWLVNSYHQGYLTDKSQFESAYKAFNRVRDADYSTWNDFSLAQKEKEFSYDFSQSMLMDVAKVLIDSYGTDYNINNLVGQVMKIKRHCPRSVKKALELSLA